MHDGRPGSTLTAQRLLMIFISHSHRDEALVTALNDRLLQNAFGIASTSIYCSSLPEKQFDAGELIDEAITERLDKANLVVFLLTSSFLNSKWCRRELKMAVQSGKKLLPLREGSLSVKTIETALPALKGRLMLDLSQLSDLSQLYKPFAKAGYIPEPNLVGIQRHARQFHLEYFTSKDVPKAAGRDWPGRGLILALLVLVLLGGWLGIREIVAPQTFTATVFVHGKAGRDERILRNEGQVLLSLGGDERLSTINEKGEATFKEVPIAFAGKKVSVRIDHSQPYRPTHPDSLYLLREGAVLYVEVALQHTQRLFGKVMDFETEQWIDSVRVSVEDTAVYTDAYGWFELLLPEEKQRKFQRVSLYKPGYAIQEMDSIPVHTRQPQRFSLIPLQP